MAWHKQVNEVLEDVITDIMFVCDASRETAEVAAATMIRYPGLLIELAEMVKNKRAARASE